MLYFPIATIACICKEIIVFEPRANQRWYFYANPVEYSDCRYKSVG